MKRKYPKPPKTGKEFASALSKARADGEEEGYRIGLREGQDESAKKLSEFRALTPNVLEGLGRIANSNSMIAESIARMFLEANRKNPQR